MTSKARKAAAPDSGAAAVAERAPEPKTLEWRGIDLTLPPSPRTMGITAAFRRLSRAADAEDNFGTMQYMIDLVDAILGGNEQLSDKVWAKIDEDGDDEFDAVFDLLERSGECYSVTPGESPASP